VTASSETQDRARVPPRWQSDATLAAVTVIWGTTFVVVKSALSGISAAYFLALRFWIASACMALLFLRPFIASERRQVLRGLRGGAFAGVFLWMGYILQTFGLKYTSAGTSGFITGLYIVLVPLVGAVIYRKRPQASEIVGILIATAGMILLTLPSLKAMRPNIGDVLTLGCAGAFAVHLVVLGHYAQREHYEAVALGQILCAAVLSTLALLWEPPRIMWSPNLVMALVLTGVFATAVAFSLQTWGQQYTSSTRTALIFALEPVFALATAVTFGNEGVTRVGLAGAALILGGILMVELKPIASS
jgi:drug/metabolite transporter (DMT)-like permease